MRSICFYICCIDECETLVRFNHFIRENISQYDQKYTQFKRINRNITVILSFHDFKIKNHFRWWIVTKMKIENETNAVYDQSSSNYSTEFPSIFTNIDKWYAIRMLLKDNFYGSILWIEETIIFMPGILERLFYIPFVN